jgi:ribosomal protein S27E
MSSFYGKKANDCKHEKMTTDFETREVLCGYCGKVLNRKEHK